MNKFNKGKLIGVVAASLSAVSLMSVGFASWLIEGKKEGTTDGITVEVGAVTDNRISITGVSVEEGAIAFDAAAQNTDGAILKKTGDGVEDLSFKIKYTVNNTNATNKFHVFAYIETTKQATFTDANNKKLITMPTALNITETGTPVNSISFTGETLTFAKDVVREANQAGNGTVTVTQTFTFGWGKAFGGLNPSAVLGNTKVYDIQNDKDNVDATEDILIHNINALGNLKESLSNFKVVLMPAIDK